jgi:hypothetical protein
MISTVFRREVVPLVMVSADREHPSTSARNRISASLAAPSTGGAVRRILSAPPCSPSTALREPRGWMWRVIRDPPSSGTSQVESAGVTAGQIQLSRNERARVSIRYATSGLKSKGPSVGSTFWSGSMIQLVRAYTSRIGLE